MATPMPSKVSKSAPSPGKKGMAFRDKPPQQDKLPQQNPSGNNRTATPQQAAPNQAPGTVPIPGVGDLDLNKIADKATKGDLQGAAGEALSQIGVGKKIGHLLFAIWGIAALATGVVPILGLFSGSALLVIFNLLLVSPKLVYRITEVILDAIGIGEVLQVADRFGVSKSHIQINGIEKAGIVVFDIGFLLWHGIFIFGILYGICSVVGVGSNIPIVGSVLNVGAAGAEWVTGLPIAQTRQLCQALPSFGGGGNFSGGGAGGSVGPISSGCDINQGYCKPETLAQKGQEYGCNWDPTLMSRICTHESNGVSKMSGTDRCNQMVTYPDGHTGYLSWSGGLFQIDIFTATSSIFPECAGLVAPTDTSPDGTGSQFIKSHGSCVGGVNGGHWKGNYCDLRNCGLKPGIPVSRYQACVNALNNIEENYKVACTKFKSSGYRAWPDSAQKCGAL